MECGKGPQCLPLCDLWRPFQSSVLSPGCKVRKIRKPNQLTKGANKANNLHWNMRRWLYYPGSSSAWFYSLEICIVSALGYSSPYLYLSFWAVFYCDACQGRWPQHVPAFRWWDALLSVVVAHSGGTWQDICWPLGAGSISYTLQRRQGSRQCLF